jgi:hypothetical protein
MNNIEFVENYKDGVIRKIKSGKFTLYEWSKYLPDRSFISYVFKTVDGLKKIVDNIETR